MVKSSSVWGGVGWLRNDIMGMMLDSEIHHDIAEDIIGDSYLRINSPLGDINKILDDSSDLKSGKNTFDGYALVVRVRRASLRVFKRLNNLTNSTIFIVRYVFFNYWIL